MKQLGGFLWFGLGVSVLAAGVLYLSPKATPMHQAPAIFVGDSITHRLRVDQVVDGGVNLGVESRTTAELLAAMPAMHLERGDLVVLMIGTNDLRQHRTAGLEGRLREVGRRIHGHLLWNAIPPMPGYDVAPTNALIERLCSERGDCVYVTTPWAAGDFQSDGVHPNAEGNAKWAQSLRNALPAPTV